jgi:hypothetical protein
MHFGKGTLDEQISKPNILLNYNAPDDLANANLKIFAYVEMGIKNLRLFI